MEALCSRIYIMFFYTHDSLSSLFSCQVLFRVLDVQRSNFLNTVEMCSGRMQSITYVNLSAEQFVFIFPKELMCLCYICCRLASNGQIDTVTVGVWLCVCVQLSL